MSLNLPLIAELQHEAAVTRKMLERLPEKEFDWKPHEKSMSLGQLATHVAEMFDWLPITIKENELDFAAMDYQPTIVKTTAELVDLFDKKYADGLAALQSASDEQFAQDWTLRSGVEVYFKMPKIQVIRGMIFNHIVHHRGQLSVYMRLKDVPLPAIYGPSADENPS